MQKMKVLAQFYEPPTILTERKILQIDCNWSETHKNTKSATPNFCRSPVPVAGGRPIFLVLRFFRSSRSLPRPSPPFVTLPRPLILLWKTFKFIFLLISLKKGEGGHPMCQALKLQKLYTSCREVVFNGIL